MNFFNGHFPRKVKFSFCPFWEGSPRDALAARAGEGATREQHTKGNLDRLSGPLAAIDGSLATVRPMMLTD